MIMKKSRRTVKLWLVTSLVVVFLLFQALLVVAIRTTEDERQGQEKTRQKTEEKNHKHEHEH